MGRVTTPAFPVLWVDPGKMTGLAIWLPDGRFWAGEFLFQSAADIIEGACREYRSELRAGWEHFRVHPRTPPDDAHHAIEMIGVARRAIYVNRCVQLGPAMPDQRLIAKPALLEAIGWWLPGQDDAQSAAQHLLAYMLRTGMVPAREQVILAGLIREKMGDGDEPKRL